MRERVLQIHNRYASGLGGEDMVVEAERRLLEANGHAVETLLGSNAALERTAGLARLVAGARSIWSSRAVHTVRAAIARFRPDVVHVHNTFAELSPSVLWAAHRAGRPTVLTLHNYRTVCPTSVLLRDGRPCENCVGRLLPWPAVRHGCTYRNSRILALLVGATQVVHRALGTYRDAVDAFIVHSEFARSIFARAGLPAERIHLVPNILEGSRSKVTGNATPTTFAFVGLLAPFKGPDLLLEAWRAARLPGAARLHVVGSGPLYGRVAHVANSLRSVTVHGALQREAVQALLRGVGWLVIPSRCYEAMPMVLLEAFSAGCPVIAPRHGPFPELVSHGRDGLLFTPGDSRSLGETLERAAGTSAPCWQSYSEAARQRFERDWSVEVAYRRLMAVYRKAAAERNARRREVSSGG